MNVVITINGEDYVVELKEALKICKQIHEQVYV